ncbi:hypothetical protein STAFG_6511 [Streptomyces afghaniensis 772]|uniref:Uncharacterized protein n=1 Tax=Streptomyces afghaniensis 772 TaxID=1283301 RepID=S4NDV5_9ACTN|nr:hypothetical protein STAFG_6511 [Streptomyces afghaniensis 772]
MLQKATPETGGTPVRRRWFALLLRDRFACAAALVLVLVALCAVLGPLLAGDLATSQNLRAPGRPPFSLDHGWAFVLGSDSLGRPVAARLLTAAGTTLAVAVPAVLCSLVIGSVWGMWAGYHGGWRENASLRVADVILSFPPCCWPWWCCTCSRRVRRASCWCWPSPGYPCICARPGPRRRSCAVGCSWTRPVRSARAAGRPSAGMSRRVCCRRCSP